MRPGAQVDRHGSAQGGRVVLRDGRRAPSRYRHYRGSGGRGDPHRPPLRHAGDGTLRDSRYRPRLAGLLQHARGPGHAGRRSRQGARGVPLMDLNDLYQDVIVDHNRSPRNFRKMADATRTQEGFNPLCGDKLMLYIKLDGDRISDVSFEGSGCAISVASASLMSQNVKGKPLREAEQLFGRMRAMLTGDGQEMDLESLGNLAALSGVSAYPSRVKCASLCWHALKAALQPPSQARPVEVSTE